MIQKTTTTTLCLVVLLLSFSGCSIPPKKKVSALQTTAANKERPNWSGTFEAPKDVSWRTTIAPEGEPGAPLIISGTVYLPDGKTPAKDVIVYVYHTNHKGVYPKNGDEKGHGKYHGYLRGWMKTNANGVYEFKTIRPAPYDRRDAEPAHIHYTIEAPNYPEYWLTGLWFADDPIVQSYKDTVERDGGFSNVTELTKDDQNILRGTRNIILQHFDD